VNHVRPNGLDLVQQVLLAGQTDSCDQDERSRSYHHAEGCKSKAHLVAGESLVSKAENFSQAQSGPLGLRFGDCIHDCLDASHLLKTNYPPEVSVCLTIYLRRG